MVRAMRGVPDTINRLIDSFSASLIQYGVLTQMASSIMYKVFDLYAILNTIYSAYARVAPSSSGQGHRPLTAETTGSNPVGVTRDSSANYFVGEPLVVFMGPRVRQRK